MTKQFSHAASILPVEDVMKSMLYYRDELGFDIAFSLGELPEYAAVTRESVGIHFPKREDSLKPSKHHTAVFIFVHEVDKLYEEYQSKNVEITNPIGNRDYGMRDFDIRDINGYILSFGTGLKE